MRSLDLMQFFYNDPYIRDTARSLPIKGVYMTQNWEDEHIVRIVVARQHLTGYITTGVFIIDMYCRGLFQTFYRYNLPFSHFTKCVEKDYEEYNMIEVPYEQAHTLIYAAIMYAANLGIPPDERFELLQYMLEDNASIHSSCEHTFGYCGFPYLIVDSEEEAGLYLPALKKNAGSEFQVKIRTEFTEKELQIKAEDEKIAQIYECVKNIMLGIENDVPDRNSNENNDNDEEEEDKLPYEIREGEYSYIHPDYPTSLELIHPELEVLYVPQYKYQLPADVIADILSLPHETLIDDLIGMLYVAIGKTAGWKGTMLWHPDYISPIRHIILLLGELKAEKSLKVVLELLRQSFSFMNFHFGSYDTASKILPFTIYLIGGRNLPALKAYVREPGLEAYMRINVFHGVTYIFLNEPERRDEAITWFREQLLFFLENADNPSLYDSTLVAMIACALCDVHATELIPDLKLLYDQMIVDLSYSGDFDEIIRMMEEEIPDYTFRNYALMNIYERYEYLLKYTFSS